MAEEDYTIRETPERTNEMDALFEQWFRAGTAPDGTEAPGSANTATAEDTGTTGSRATDDRSARSDTPVPMPEGFDVRRSADSIAIDRRWKGIQYVFTLVFAVIWNAILIPFAAGFSGAAGSMGAMGGVFILFLLPFFAVGIGMIYLSTAGFLNTTTITVSDGTLRVTHSPVPWPGAISLPAGEIVQLYTREVRHSHTGSSGSRRRRTSYSYRVMVIYGAQNREKRLISGLTDPGQAFFIEYTIEQFLGIADRRVRGELRKD